jgi:arylsulfatase A-like enzyme
MKSRSGRDEPKGTTVGNSVSRRSILLAGTAIVTASALVSRASLRPAQTQEQAALPEGKRPNILVIWGDDIGWQNVSAYGMGTMGYTTPNLDRIGTEGIRFTDQYAQNSWTAGRASFITGQYPIRSGMVTVGVPGDKLGLQPASPCLAEVLKKAGYATGHFGKNHLGDRNEHLPTAHGFDEFFGNLYHLNTQEQPEYRDYQEFAKAYPGGPEAFANKYGTRGVLHAFATDTDDPTEDVRFGRVGRQRIEDTGPLTMERMEDFDASEVMPKAFDFNDESQAGSPTVLCLAQHQPHAPLYAAERKMAFCRGQIHARRGLPRRWHAAARPRHRAGA